MKYLILIYSNPQSRAVWDGFSDAQRAEGLAVYAALTEDLVASGELIVSEALADPSLARRVSVRDGGRVGSPGGGGESMQRAIEHAARIPEAAHDLVEVRPVLTMAGLEL